MKCPICNNLIDNDSNFCAYCGCNIQVTQFMTEEEIVSDILYLINRGNVSAAAKYYANTYKIDLNAAMMQVEEIQNSRNK